MFVQHLSQLDVYGDTTGKDGILGNTSLHVAFKLGPESDREYFSKEVGRTTRRTCGTSTTSGASASSSSSTSEVADDAVHQWEWREMAPDRAGAVVVKLAENGVPGGRTGVLRTRVADATVTPTRGHFDLGSREHETCRRKASQEALDRMGEERRGQAADVWTPSFKEAAPLPEEEGEWAEFLD